MDRLAAQHVAFQGQLRGLIDLVILKLAVLEIFYSLGFFRDDVLLEVWRLVVVGEELELLVQVVDELVEVHV